MRAHGMALSWRFGVSGFGCDDRRWRRNVGVRFGRSSANGDLAPTVPTPKGGEGVADA